MSSPILPALIFFLGAVAVGMLRGRAQSAVALLIPLLGGANLLFNVDHGAYWQLGLFDYTLTLMRVDKLSLLFGYLFHLAAFIGVVYALHVRDTTQQVSALLYAGGALGAVFAGDLITLFVFWEILAVTSVFLIWARRTARAQAAGMRYLLVQIASGVILLAGALMYLHQTGSVAFEQMQLDGPGTWLIFLAFGIKCAFPLLHNWVTDAYPEATPTGAVFLSAFTTKVAVYAFARAFPGTEWLIYIGVAMAAFPIFYAVIENDLRRVLCYSMINQVGFMVVGIGLGTELALNGAVSHAFNDVIFKGLLFMSMGAVLHMTGKMNGSELGGLYKTMPITTVLCIVGAASISAFPLFSGFVSKAMVMAAALEEGYDWVWLVLLFASAGVFHHAGIKIPFFAFFAHDSGIRAKDPPLNMLIAMFIAAAICIFNGSYPWILYSLLPWPVDYAPYTWTHVITQTQLLFFSALAFIFLKLTHLYPPELPSTNIDAEWAYRRLLPRVVNGMVAMFAPLDRAMRGLTLARLERIVERLYRHHGPEGIMARTWPTGSTALWVAILLAVYLLLSYV
ncbi:MAG: Na(+)/H(+) antiporter subunit D [Alphaproteobacteria bacterium]|nr:Na(+)/H(+) antiporter subunit D [Alphaproteobacteria bacterium]